MYALCIAHDVERINLALRLPEKVNDIASEKIGQHALLCNKKAINKRSGLDAFPTEFTALFYWVFTSNNKITIRIRRMLHQVC